MGAKSQSRIVRRACALRHSIHHNARPEFVGQVFAFPKEQSARSGGGISEPAESRSIALIPRPPLRSIISSFFVVRSNKESLDRDIKLNRNTFRLFIFSFTRERKRTTVSFKVILKNVFMKKIIVACFSIPFSDTWRRTCENYMSVDPWIV